MDACNNVGREIQSVDNKFKAYHEMFKHKCCLMYDLYRQIEAFLQSQPSSESANFDDVTKSCEKLRTISSKLSGDHRDLHPAVSKIGKTIDKNFSSDFDCKLLSNTSSLCWNTVCERQSVNTLILDHLCRTPGRREVADSLRMESAAHELLNSTNNTDDEIGVMSDEDFQQQFNFDAIDDLQDKFDEINQILHQLNNGDVQPALQWSLKHRKQLNSFGISANASTSNAVYKVLQKHLKETSKNKECISNSSCVTTTDTDSLSHLEIRLHMLKFVHFCASHRKSRFETTSSGIVDKSTLIHAIQYARQHFDKIVNKEKCDAYDICRSQSNLDKQKRKKLYKEDVERLMGCLIFCLSSPTLPLNPSDATLHSSEMSDSDSIITSSSMERRYSEYLLSDKIWTDTSHLLMREACRLYKISCNSPLSVAINAGCKVLPSLLTLKQVMQQQCQLGNVMLANATTAASISNSANSSIMSNDLIPSTTHVNNNNNTVGAVLQHQQINRTVGSLTTSTLINSSAQLPIEIDLGWDFRFHSVFACPILRQETCESNPPLRLTCGHAISRDALSKLTSSTSFSKVKCPYCPVEQNPADAKRIYL